MTINKKFKVMFAAVGTFCAIISVFSYLSFVKGHRSVSRLVERREPIERALLEMEIYLTESVRAIPLYLAKTIQNEQIANEFMERLVASKAKFMESYETLSSLAIDENVLELASRVRVRSTELFEQEKRIIQFHTERIQEIAGIDSKIELSVAVANDLESDFMKTKSSGQALQLFDIIEGSENLVVMTYSLMLNLNPKTFSRSEALIHNLIEKIDRLRISDLPPSQLIQVERIGSLFRGIVSHREKLLETSKGIRQVLSEIDESLGNIERLLDEDLKLIIREATQNSANAAITSVRNNYFVAVGLIVVIVFSLVSLWWYTRVSILKPIAKLSGATKEIANNNYRTILYVKNDRDELGELANSFNEMTQILDDTRNALLKTKEDAEIAKIGAEAANREKSTFLANMSHEIRTPLTAIMGFVEILKSQQGMGVSQTQTILQVIDRSSKHLAQLIDDVLDVAKIESGHIEIEETRVNLVEEIDSVVQSIRIKTQSAGLDFSVQYSSPVPEVILSDSLRLRQILYNLLGNAVKFTDLGSVALDIRFDDLNALKPSRLYFTIEDTGCGIVADKLQEVFRPFCQADISTTRRFGGTGLGLDLSRRLARLLGGDVVIKSSIPGKGSVFELSIAAKCPEGTGTGTLIVENQNKWETDDPVISKSQGILRHVKVLIVEDSQDIQMLFRAILEVAGADVCFASDGAEALAAAETKHYDVILMDIQLPDMDGYQVTRELRKMGCKIPIVALTANALLTEKERCLSSGCDDYRSKPLPAGALINLVADWSHGRANHSAQ